MYFSRFRLTLREIKGIVIVFIKKPTQIFLIPLSVFFNKFNKE